MINNYPLKYKKFSKVLFVSGNPETGQRIKLDPADFNDMQDIWAGRLDDFMAAIRGLESGILDGCSVVVQAKQMTNAASGYEVVVSPGNVYVNSNIVCLAIAHALELPAPSWVGFKSHYLIVKPIIGEESRFIPTAIGDPGFSLLSGRRTSDRLEVKFDLQLVTELPSNSDEWYVLLAELKIDSTINGPSDVIIDLSNRNTLSTMREIQDVANQTKTNLNNHVAFYFVKQPVLGATDGSNKLFYTQVPVIADSLDSLQIYQANGAALVPASGYTTTTVESDKTRRTQIEFSLAPTAGDLICASYYPDTHFQYLSAFSFAKHIQPDSESHDNRYFTRSETNAWREEHNVNKDSHLTHVLWDDFNSWKNSHVGSATTEHDQVYSRVGHSHTIDKIVDLRDGLTKIEEEIGYGNDDYYFVTQKIVQGIDGVNKIFPLTSSLLDSGLGYVKQVRADITNDAVANPVILSVIDSAQEFDTPIASAFSEPKRLSQKYINSNPTSVVQSDGEAWAFWSAQEDNTSKIWFASYKQGDGFFSPATTTGLQCNLNAKISATVITSSTATINQRIVITWEYNNKIYYSWIDKGQSEWQNATELLGSDNCYEPAIAWINDNSTHGKLYLLYRKIDTTNGLAAIYRRRYEINFAEFDIETRVSEKNVDHVSPFILQEKSTLKRIWYLWLAKESTATNTENTWGLNYKIVERFGDSVYQAESTLGNISSLSILSGISASPKNDGVWVQFAQPSGGLFNVYYQTFNYNGSPLEEPVFLAKGNKNGVSFSSNDTVWTIYEYIDSIYYRVRQKEVGEVKWNKGLKRLEFEAAPVTYPIYVDIAVPLRSLNERVTALESKEADTEEELSSKIRDNIIAMGLESPAEELARMLNKVRIEADVSMDTRRRVLGYDIVLYNKFFNFNATTNIPDGFMTEMLKGASPTLFATAGIYHDNTGIIWNKTGQIIKVYTTIYSPTSFAANGRIRLEAHGSENLVDFRITSTMESSPFAPTIKWIPATSKIQLNQDLNLSGDTNFVGHNRFALEITLRPNGFLYDWAWFMKG